MNLIKEAESLLNLTNPGFLEKLNPVKRAQVISYRVSDLLEEIAEEKEGLEREAKRKAKRKKLDAEEKKKRAEKEKRIRELRRFKQWNPIIRKAESFYGDVVFEWCSEGLNSNDSEDREEIHARIERGEFDDDYCRREALFTAYPSREPKFYDGAMRYWKNHGAF